MHSRSSGTWGRSDPLASVLLDLHLSGTFFCRSEFRAPWSLQIADRDFASFHFCVERECYLRVGTDNEFTQLSPGDLAFVPGSPRQVLASSQRRTGTAIASLPARAIGPASASLRVPGRDSPWVVICGGVSLTGFVASMLTDLLPDVVVLRAQDAGAIVSTTIQAMLQESRTARPGSATVMSRLADVIVVHAIRGVLESMPTTDGWLAALDDPRIGPSIAEIHRRPEHRWALPQLARLAGLSRSRFSERFTRLVGTAPMQYVTRVQMHRASELLRTERLTVAELATRFGYESEPAFARAFKRHVGTPPGLVRRQAVRSARQTTD